MKKILVIDGNSIINRAFYGIRSLSTSNGKPTGAIYGLINIIKAQLDAIKPDYAAAAFDLHTPTFRKVLYPAYKEGRHPTPPELLCQFDDAKDCLRKMGIATLELEGYEADDIQGTIAKWAEGQDGLFSYVLSGDRDLLQLIGDKVNVLLATTGDTHLFDRDAFFEKYGIEPSALVDAKALMGDSSDNIPGVSGIGEKTALKLISQFSSLDGIYENLDSPEISKKTKEKLASEREMAYLCQRLARIDTKAPLGITLEDIAYHGPNKSELYEKFRSLEFFGLIKKFALTQNGSESEKADVQIEEQEATPKAPVCPCHHTEAKCVDASEMCRISTDICAIALDGESFYLANEAGLFCTQVGKELSPLFDGGKTLVCHDSKALWHSLIAHGITLNCVMRDLSLYAYVLDSSKGGRSLYDLILAECGVQVNSVCDALPQFLPLYENLRKRADEDGCLALVEQVELPLALLLARMEHAGFYIDRDGMRAFSEELEASIAEAEENVYTLAGRQFNINSPKQLSAVLTEDLGIALKKKTKSGFSTDVEALEQVRNSHPIIDEILEYRKLTKLHSTYAVGLLRACDENGRIHTDFRQALTATGRLSSSEPNLQNIPIKTSLGKRIRAQFCAEGEDYVLVDADYSQIELRLLACMSADEGMVDAFKNGADIHTRTASYVFGVPEYAVTEEYRKRAKAVNFGIVYGIGAYSLSSDLKISMSQAKQYIESYFATYPSIKEYLDTVVASATELGYTVTLFGRKRYIPELASSKRQMQEFGRRVAMNSPIQGSAADIMKIAMLGVEKALLRENLDARLVMQVHDELIVEAHKDCAGRVREILEKEMMGAASLAVPLTVDAVISKRWAE